MTSPSDWTALILAGGFGTRLQPVVRDRPKPMALVAGRPFVAGATTLLVETGYGTETANDAMVAPDYVVADLGEAARVIEGLLAGQRPAAAAVRVEEGN